MNHEPDNLSSYGDSLKDCLISSASIHGAKKAISFFREGSLETEISYLELDRDSNRMANTFLNLGVSKGDRVVLYIPKSLFFVIAHVALQKIGAVGVPLNPGFKKWEMSYLLGDADARLIVSGPEQEAVVK